MTHEHCVWCHYRLATVPYSKRVGRAIKGPVCIDCYGIELRGKRLALQFDIIERRAIARVGVVYQEQQP